MRALLFLVLLGRFSGEFRGHTGMSEHWEMQEPGWYTLRGLGGICQETDGWYFYPLEGEAQGPFPTLAVAALRGDTSAPQGAL